jgi:lytic cellulose monooxygenase (C1-hydroxylating)
MHLSQAGLVMLLAHQVYGHGYVTNFKTDGLDNGGYLLNYYYQKKNGQAIPNVAAWSAENLDSGFIAPDNYTSPDIVCSVNGQPAGSTAQVKAGGTVSFTWNKWAHFGPVMTYVARCDGNCSTVDKTKLKFIKIDEAGIDFDTQEWAATKMVNNNLTWVTTVPETLAPGYARLLVFL